MYSPLDACLRPPRAAVPGAHGTAQHSAMRAAANQRTQQRSRAQGAGLRRVRNARKGENPGLKPTFSAIPDKNKKFAL